MPIELTPNGTQGSEFPKALRPLASAMQRLTTVAYRLFGSRMRMQGVPFLLLDTVGAKTGKQRTALLPRFKDSPPGTWLVAASGLGSAHHPDWYINLASDPDNVWVEVDHHRVKVRPESLLGLDREEAWQRITEAAPRFGAYAQKTDRIIPIVRLSPTEESS